jgi:hypothetical protein
VNAQGSAIGEEAAWKELDAKIRLMLPPEYQAHYEEVQPVSMGSAGLRYDKRGRVAWDEIWESFCDLAMAGGPPHKGKFLEPASAEEIAAAPAAYEAVVEELCRGLAMVSWLPAERSPEVGWVRVECPTEVMAGWLVRAINMENVAAQLEGRWLDLPAGPRYRLEKEIKNVVTALAKTHHYFDGHMSASQQAAIGALFAEDGRLLLQAARQGTSEASREGAARRIAELTGLRPGGPAYRAWLGLECPTVGAAIWLMRALVVGNLVSRREECTLYVPLNPALDPEGARVAAEVGKVYRLARERGLFG